MKLKSTEFNDYYILPKTFGNKLGNIMPTLYVEDVPPGTTSLALVVYDTEIVYYDRELTYWLVWNLPIDIGEFSDRNLPAGVVQGTNDMGEIGFTGPTLERENHHIHFLLFALKSDLYRDASANRKEFDSAVKGNSIEHSDLIGIYQSQEQQA